MAIRLALFTQYSNYNCQKINRPLSNTIDNIIKEKNNKVFNNKKFNIIRLLTYKDNF